METTKGHESANVTSQGKKSFWFFLSSLNVLAARRRHKAEQLLLQSFKASYPRWEKEGLIQKPRHLTETTKA